MSVSSSSSTTSSGSSGSGPSGSGPSGSSSSVSVSPSPILPRHDGDGARHSDGADDIPAAPIRIMLAITWFAFVQPYITIDALISGCFQFISNVAGCIGLICILFVAIFPIVYAITPVATANFKVVSLCPSIEYAFNKLDNFIANTQQVIHDRMNELK